MDPEKTIILVVHGVGEQLPAATIDSLVGATTDQLQIPGRVSGHTELLVDREFPRKTPVPPTAPDVEATRDVPPGKGKPGQLSLFPCAIRRTTLSKDNEHAKIFLNGRDHELLAAEVFWADLSTAPNGLVGTIRDLLHTVLALGYLALDNIEQSGRDTSQCVRWLVQKFVFVFYAMIAPLNALMFGGAIALLLMDVVSKGETSTPLWLATLFTVTIFSAFAAFGAWKYQKSRMENRSLLAVDFWLGFMVFAALTAVIAIILVAALPVAQRESETFLRGVAFGLVMMMVMGWGFALSTLIAMILLSLLEGLLPFRRSARRMRTGYRRWRSGHRWGITKWAREKRDIHISICSAMMVLWTLFSASFWTTLAWILSMLSGTLFNQGLFQLIYDESLPRATATLTFVLIGVLVLVILGVALGFIRYRYRGDLRRGEPEGRLDIWIGRVILNPLIGTLLLLMTIWIGFGAIRALISIMNEFLLNSSGNTVACTASDASQGKCQPTNWAIIVATFLGVILIVLRKQVAATLGIVRDVTAYSIRSVRNVEGKPYYPVRADMLRRFNIVLRYAVQQMPDADRLMIIAHSQGTMIATAGLCANGESLPTECDIITLGSPYGHIYRQYFPAGVDVGCLGRQVSYWLNIFRSDDYIGASIKEPELKVDNACIGSGGHTHYWTDTAVWDVAKDILRKKNQNGTSSSVIPTG